MTNEDRHPSDGMTPRDFAALGMVSQGSEQQETPSLRSSMESLRDLAGTLAEIPGEIRSAAARAVLPRTDGMPEPRRAPLRRALRAAAWPLAVVIVSGAMAVLVLAVTGGLR